jgi:hypothetical protein
VTPDYGVPPASVHDGVVYVRIQGPVSQDTAGAMTLSRPA